MGIVSDVQEFFFEAMQAGWASGSSKQPVLGMPGYKRISYESGGWRLVDEYCTRPASRYSSGTTTIWIEGFIAWIMQYQGWYKPEGSKVAKAALREAYSNNIWMGGRGPAEFQSGGLVYKNEAKGDFQAFSGQESVVPVGSRGSIIDSVGTHVYRGMWFRILEG